MFTGFVLTTLPVVAVVVCGVEGEGVLIYTYYGNVTNVYILVSVLTDY